MVTRNWKREKLSNLADTCLGKMLDQKKNKGDYYPYLANLNVRWGSIELDDLREMRFETKEFGRYGLQYGDIVMCEGGEPGRCAIWKNQKPSMMIQKALHRIRAKPGVDSAFLFYSLLNTGLQGQFDGYFTGAAIKHLTGENLRKVELNVPALATQKKIAAILSTYDDVINNNLERIKLLEEMAQITYEEWFVRMKFPGYEEVELDLETGLPIGWKTQTLRELTSYINRGVAPKYVESEGFPVINQKCIREHLVNFTESRLTASDHKVPKDKLLHSLDILVNSTGTGTLGRVAQLFDCPDKATVDTHVTIVRPSNDVSAYWLGRSLEAIEPFIVNLGKGATNQQELGRNDLADIVKLNTPTEDLMARFDDFARPIFETITNLLNQNGLLKEARDILLPRLMTGMIDIDKVELPAALLERINKQNNNETNIG
ncbi:restriction endonuclease subunit S [Vibrio vulnificus]|nr:restriction endonuclease subunit S [Vibrio vulnificus]EIE9609380.1 restriction endonuclease subunit S [Vibrio parahaemolyticus]EIJ0947642.1 restriction endonuclease subunit S [Vibrio vulnificus]EJD0674362.1 restriction endonuclease subunit S [Vibrio vulnificus]EJE4707482.1 restriction endonuclease subunit S [Vibrio parahaemolyticus]